jgi:hypothetical protein
MIWIAAIAAWLAFNAIVAAALYFKPLPARRSEDSATIISIHRRRARS